MGVTLVPSPFSWGRNPFQCEAGEAWTWLSHQDPARAGAGPGRDPRQPLQGPRSGGGRCRAGLAQAPPEGPARGAAGGGRHKCRRHNPTRQHRDQQRAAEGGGGPLRCRPQAGGPCPCREQQTCQPSPRRPPALTGSCPPPPPCCAYGRRGRPADGSRRPTEAGGPGYARHNDPLRSRPVPV